MLHIHKLTPVPKYCFILYDSEYAAKSVMGEFNGPKNKLLITRARGIKQEVEKLMRDSTNSAEAGIIFVKVKAHANNHFNDVADHLANQGSAGVTIAE